MENNARNLPEVATGTVRDAVNHFAPRYDNQCYQLFSYYLAKNHTKLPFSDMTNHPKPRRILKEKPSVVPNVTKHSPSLHYCRTTLMHVWTKIEIYLNKTPERAMIFQNKHNIYRLGKVES